jgi:chloramphenicol 3-O-phosphotransferase
MHHTIRLCSNLGNGVIVDHVKRESKGSWEECRELLAGNLVLYVKVPCPLPEPVRRENEREDREIGNAESITQGARSQAGRRC